MSEITEERALKIHRMVAEQLWSHPAGCIVCQPDSFCSEWHRLAGIKKKWLGIKVSLQRKRCGLE